MNNQILNNLINFKKKDLNKFKLTNEQILKISNNLTSDIFNSNECVIWEKYKKKESKTKYLNIKINNKKMALHRVIFINYIDDLKKNEYVKYTCCNKGICFNLKHLKKKNQKDHSKSKPNNIISFD